MKRFSFPDKKDWNELLKRPVGSLLDIEPVVLEIFEDVKQHADAAVRKYTKTFDKVDLAVAIVSEVEIDKAKGILDEGLKEAITLAKHNIEKFHRAQITVPVRVETTNGVVCWQEKRPVQKVGLYIPGGTAPLFSTILMLAIPAKIAGCEEIILCTPPDNYGNINPAILYAADLCGVDKIFKIGGIQAVAAMTFGTETVLKVDKIYGPGNQYVTVAKQLSTKFGVAIDMPAGPSELLVVADETANASFVASDLLSQAEHGTDSQVILVSTSQDFLNEVEVQISEQMRVLPRKEIAEVAISNSKIILCENDEIAMDLINNYAPEHLIIAVRNTDFYISHVKNAGSVFIGNYTPESAGDYASGTNHTLPTNGYARNYSGVNLDAFMKAITFQEITKKGLQNIGKAIEKMAEAEGLQAHKNAVTIRLSNTDNEN